MKILNTRILKKGVITLSFLCYLITCGFVPYYYDEATNLCYGDGFFDLFFGWFCFIFPEIFTKIYSLAWFSNITYIVAIRHLIKGNRKHFVLWICITIILSSLLIICPKTETDTWGNIHHFTLTIGYYLRIISFFILFVGGIFVILKMNINMTDITEKTDNGELVTNRDQLVGVDNIEPLIKIFRGQQVMLDRDLATLYGVETKRLNEQVYNFKM